MIVETKTANPGGTEAQRANFIPSLIVLRIDSSVMSSSSVSESLLGRDFVTLKETDEHGNLMSIPSGQTFQSEYVKDATVISCNDLSSSLIIHVETAICGTY